MRSREDRSWSLFVRRSRSPRAALTRGARHRNAIYVAAAVSGASSLIYEIGWSRALTLPVGATYASIAAVAAGTMLGLGIGAEVGGRWAARHRAPLRAYAGVEGALAVLSLAFPLVYLGVGRVPEGSLGGVTARALLAGLGLVPATALMGATFPILATALGDGRPARIPALYGANTLGATVGATLGGLVLPYAVGIPATLAVALLLNVTAAAIALAADRRAPRATSADSEAPVRQRPERCSRSRSPRGPWCSSRRCSGPARCCNSTGWPGRASSRRRWTGSRSSP